MSGGRYHERVHFRLIEMPCCGHLFCNVNPRLPSYCPECGQSVFALLRTRAECVKVSDPEATLSVHHETAP